MPDAKLSKLTYSLHNLKFYLSRDIHWISHAKSYVATN